MSNRMVPASCYNELNNAQKFMYCLIVIFQNYEKKIIPWVPQGPFEKNLSVYEVNICSGDDGWVDASQRDCIFPKYKA